MFISALTNVKRSRPTAVIKLNCATFLHFCLLGGVSRSYYSILSRSLENTASAVPCYSTDLRSDLRLKGWMCKSTERGSSVWYHFISIIRRKWLIAFYIYMHTKTLSILQAPQYKIKSYFLLAYLNPISLQISCRFQGNQFGHAD